MSYYQGSEQADMLFDNPDSFAISFDKAWKEAKELNTAQNIDLDTKIENTLNTIKHHPFMKSSPSKAKEVALFRTKLLNLD